MLKKGNRGFTILEVAIVIILMGIIGVIAVPSVGLIRKQEVKKLAKEMCLDLTTQRIRAMTTSGVNYSLELIDTAALTYYNSYQLSPVSLTASGTIREKNVDNSKNIQITMESLDSLGAVTATGITGIQFDNYGYMTEMGTTNDIYKLTVSIQYDTAEAKIDFYGITGNYTIY